MREYEYKISLGHDFSFPHTQEKSKAQCLKRPSAKLFSNGVGQEEYILESLIGVWAGRERGGGECRSPPQKKIFGQLRFFVQQEKFGQSQFFKEVCICVCVLFFSEEKYFLF